MQKERKYLGHFLKRLHVLGSSLLLLCSLTMACGVRVLHAYVIICDHGKWGVLWALRAGAGSWVVNEDPAAAASPATSKGDRNLGTPGPRLLRFLMAKRVPGAGQQRVSRHPRGGGFICIRLFSGLGSEPSSSLRAGLQLERRGAG